ncbi:glucoamylase [Plectosphaerella cucumerina]|uniref:Glucoamylase n=1 Tax=Plectosphaerella cucumerina TaxID=40658 RepID=A0A8K0T7Z0_9PEZI|nr:glucoamylase [Plectosphaerella cucumerina]
MKLLHLFALGISAGAAVVSGHPSSLSKRVDVEAWIAQELPIARAQLLCNVGPSGCNSAGVASGLVIASPSRQDPDYFFHWTRDAGLVFKLVVDLFLESYDAGLQRSIQDFIIGQAKLQTVSNPSGGFQNGAGLGEPKYLANGAQFTGEWGRPQRDGPALRAIALIKYAKWLIANGYTTTANTVVWPVIRNDLAYVAQYWNQTGFDLWEEVQGSSFFTIASQHRSLVEGSSLASLLGTSCTACDSIAPQVLCFQQRFWNPSQGYIVSNINGGNWRNGKDANSILTSIHNFDPALNCDSATFQPCSDRALSNHKVVVDSFRSIYAINSGIPQGQAVAVGRYPEDTYYGGHPWYLNTFAAAEQLYDALYIWKRSSSIAVTQTSLAFFRDLVPSISTGQFASGSTTYNSIISAASSYADGFVNIAATYASPNGSIAEQYNRNNGQPLSARDLTWSYASFLSAAQRRRGFVAPGWAKADSSAVPGSCFATSVQGSYTSATVTSFPTSQTPVSGVPTSVPTATVSASASTTASSTGACSTPTSVAVTFNARVTTQFGQTIKVVGNVPQLGNWNPSNAIALNANQYTASNPLWQTTINLPAGQSIQYKYINVASNGAVTWEKDPNRAWTVPAVCGQSTASRADVWQA